MQKLPTISAGIDAISSTSELPGADFVRDLRRYAARISNGSMADTITGSFRDLKVWRDSMTLVEDVYRITSRFPPQERFGLTAQVRRASVSIPSNISEGKRRKRRGAYLHHLDIALGSQGEVETQIELAFRLGFLPREDFQRVSDRVAEVGRMLNGLIESLQPKDDR